MSRPSPNTMRRLRRAVEHAEQDRPNLRGPSRRPNNRGGQKEKAIVAAMANDYLTVQLIDAEGAANGEAFDVAKPEQLRHAAAHYPGVTTLSTRDASSVDVSDGSTDETWVITPAIEIGNYVRIVPVGYSGVEVAGEDLKWQLDGEWAWADITSTPGGAA